MSEHGPILEVQKLSAGYGRSRVLFDVSLEAPRAGAVAILGRNGVGKTTLLKTLIGELRPIAGAIRFDGLDAGAHGTERRVR
ncbi:MAG TPA: ATP-binding cassette domain-containing protein, partial [Geminicoccaceae bacterium]|nr:ATP-binding cassette domain-containing protein [Geminicoccaceae bacterium]